MELDTPDGRKKYLSDKLDNLLEGINDSYGKMLLEEFNQVEIHKVGERGTASVHLRHDFYKFKLIRFFAFAFGLFLDVLTPEKIKRMHPGPIGYFVIAEK